MPRGRSGFRLPTRGMWKNTGFRPDAMLPSVSALARHQSVTVISLPHADNACKLYLLLASLSLPAPSDPTPVFSLSRRGVPRGRNQIEFDLIAKSKQKYETYHTTIREAQQHSLSTLVHFCNHKCRCLCHPACFPPRPLRFARILRQNCRSAGTGVFFSARCEQTFGF